MEKSSLGKMLEGLYWKYRLSQHKIAKLFGVSQVTIHRWFRKYNIKSRDAIEAAILANMKYLKAQFNGDLREKAYLMGYRIGDLSVKRHSRQIMVIIGTTSPSTAILVRELFNPYTAVKSYPSKSTGYSPYEWKVYCLMGTSFEFLLGTDISTWILENEEYFYSFLAGLFDAEGCVSIRRKEAYIQRTLIISNYNEALCRILRNKLYELGYNVGFQRKRGKIIGICLHNKQQIMKLILRLPLRHSEKLRWRRLFLETMNAKYWDEVKDRVMLLRSEIGSERKRYIEKARREWLRRHEEFLPVDA